jgi:hypothetical protein
MHIKLQVLLVSCARLWHLIRFRCCMSWHTLLATGCVFGKLVNKIALPQHQQQQQRRLTV